MSSSHSLSTSNTSTSGFSSYSPIRTLERQYVTSPVIQLLVRTNANCCLAGGVERLLKLQQQQQQQQQQQGSSISSLNTTTTTTATTTQSDDPFSFLNDDSTTATNTTTTDTNKQKRGISSWAKSVAKKTSSHIERGMNNLAIKADGGKTPDVLICALRDSTSGILLEMTEAQPLSFNEKERLQGCAFCIPLVLPTNIPKATLALYIKSGAALAKQKHYLLGSIDLDTSVLLEKHVQQHAYTTLVFPLQSNVVVDGHVTLLLFGNSKFPIPQTLGWSMTDPEMSGYTQNGIFHLPLHQSYGYSIQKSWFVATERAVESSIVLPIATCVSRIMQQASVISLQHATSVDQALYEHRHDSSLATKAQVKACVGYLYMSSKGGNTTTSLVNTQATCSMSWQRPDCMMEVELVGRTQVPMQQEHSQFQPVLNIPFYPPIVTRDKVLPTILASYNNKMPPYLLGNVCIAIRVSSLGQNNSSIATNGNPFDVGATTIPDQQQHQQIDEWQAILPLEAYIQTAGAAPAGPVQIPVYNTSGQQMATLVMQLQVVMPSTPLPSQSSKTVSATGGLVSCVGLDTLLEDSGSLPILDHDGASTTTTNTNIDPAMLLRRRQQLQTMGPFMTHSYLQHHVRGLRSMNVKEMDERAKQYAQVVSFGCPQDVPSHQDKTPKPFRPSSSRLEPLLSAIPFNVHVHSLSIESTAPPNNGQAQEGALFHNVTCGAPSDHARGFENIISSTNGTDGANVSTVGPVSGGLRRLEAKRVELSKAVQDAQTRLITAVGTWLVQQRRECPRQAVHYIPVSHGEISALRWNVFEATQALHHVTWTCAVRRAHVFSQALGIAITSYLTAVSDVHKAAWPDLWVRHGYLMTFEGLLSAAGKELGMIEDASVGIAMLKMVSVVLVPDNGSNGGSGERVVVPNSPFLKWVQLTPSGVGSKTQYRLEIGMDPQYYMNQIPEPLKKNTPVRLYPLLFQVGVDIRQWGANQEKNLKSQLSTRTESGEIVEEPSIVSSGGGILEDDDDDVGVTDEDVLISLNLEAFRKMNAYAHTISPIAPAGTNGGGVDFSASAAAAQIHPALATLHQHIMSSAGRMNHSILDEAASIAQSLGGGGAVFCKSGKDRTAMHVTYKSAQFGRRYLSRFTKEGSSAEVDQKVVYNDATLMRTYGTRLPICEKNVGQAKYAFNALQVKFMPDMLKPPASTLAGFLKGGRVFSGGGIES